MDLGELKAPFPSTEVEWRLKTTGQNGNGFWAMLLPYVTNRAIMNRLDEVVGPENWKNDFLPGPAGGTMCGLSIRINSEWITKWDGAQETVKEPVKGGFSDSMKRAAVQWGIGRYLYYLESQFVEVVSNKPKGRFIRVDDQKKGIKGYCVIPALPAWALPDEEITSQKQAKKEQKTEDHTANKLACVPRTGGSENKSTREAESKTPIGPAIKGITYQRKGNLIIAEGNTFSVKGTLKNAGFRWNPDAKAWAKVVNE